MQDSLVPAYDWSRVDFSSGSMGQHGTPALHVVSISDTATLDLYQELSSLGVPVLGLDGSQGIGDLTDWMGQRPVAGGYDALHLWSHGRAGRFLIGGEPIDDLSLGEASAGLAALGSLLAPDADILIHGCGVASGEQGSALLASLAELTGADLAASLDSTGGAPGANWVLEASVGSIEPWHSDLQLQLNWKGSLAEVTVGGLLFRGDLVQSGDLWSASSGSVAVGFTPYGSEAFRPLFSVSGGTTIDVADTSVSFAGSATISGTPFFSASAARPLDLDIESLLAEGQFVDGSPFAWGESIRASTLKLVNPGAGDTSDALIELSGAGTFGFGGGGDGTASPLALTNLQASLTPTGYGDASASAAGLFNAAGSSWNLSGNSLSASLSGWISSASILGSASVTIDADPLTGQFTDRGLEVASGAISGLSATISGSFTPGGSRLNGAAWRTSWSPEKLTIEGSGTLGFGTDTTGTSAAELPTLSEVSLAVSNGQFSSITGTISGDIQIAGTPWTFGAGSLAYRPEGDELRIIGNASTTLVRTNPDAVAVTLTGSGLTITAGGVSGITADSAAGEIQVAGTTLTLNDQVLSYSAAEDALNFSGRATINLDLIASDRPWVLNSLSGRIAAGAFTEFTGSVDIIQDPDNGGDTGESATKLFLGTIANAKLKVGLHVDQESLLDYIQLTGEIGVNIGVVAFSLETENEGLLIRNGDWEQFEATGEFKIMGNKFWRKDKNSGGGDSTYLKPRIYWVKATRELQVSGSFEMYLGKRIFNKPLPAGSPSTGEVLKQEAENVFILDLGTSTAPGLVMKNGELIKLQADISARQISLGFLAFKLNKAGIRYIPQAIDNGVVVPGSLGFYGELSVSLAQASSTLQGTTITATLGTGDNPGIQIINNDLSIENLKIYFGASWSTVFQINELFFEWKKVVSGSRTEYTPNGGFQFTVKGMRWGGEIGLYITEEVSETGEVLSREWKIDRFKVKWEANEDAGFRGIQVKPGIYIRKLEGELKNLFSPGDLAFVGTVGISAGPLLRVPGKAFDVHPLLVEGRVTITKTMLVVDANYYQFAYYDVSYAGTSLSTWRHLLGKGTGVLTLDWTRDIYELKGNFEALDLVRGELLVRFYPTPSGNMGFLAYGSVEIKPVPASRFDFTPLNLIEAKGALFYVVNDDANEFGAWGTITFVFSYTGGILYDIRNDDFQWLDSSDVKAYQKRANALINGTDQTYPWVREFDLEIPVTSPNVHANKLTAAIPFFTQKITSTQYEGRTGNSYTIAERLGEDDISVEVSGLPSGTTVREYVNLREADNDGVSSGEIIIEVFPSAAASFDESRTFAGLGLTSLAAKVKVKLKQNSFLAASDAVIDAVAARPNDYITGLVFVDGKADLARADWDTSKTVGDMAILPSLVIIPTIKRAAIRLGGPAGDVAVHREINGFTNETLFNATTNTSSFSREKGTVSLQVIDQQEVLAKRWMVQVAGAGVAAEVSGEAQLVHPARLVEMAAFSQQEIVANAAEYGGWDLFKGQDVLFIDATRTIRTGRIRERNQPSPIEAIVETADGSTYNVYLTRIKPLWIEHGVAQIRAGAGIQQVLPGETFLAMSTGQAAALRNDAGGRDYFELFEATAPIRFGAVPTEAPAVLSSRALRLAALPDAVGAVLDSTTDKRLDSFHRSSDWTVSTLGGGVGVPVTAVHGNPVQIGSINMPLSLFAGGQRLIWEEDQLAPTPRYVFMTADDKIHPTSFTDFVAFTPSPEVIGKVLLRDASGAEQPLAGVRVYFDANGNQRFDDSERATITGSSGDYYFYDVASLGNQLDFDLPGNLTPADGQAAAVTFLRGNAPIAEAPRFVVLPVYPMITGRVGVDANTNGLIDEGEQGFPLATVLVSGADGTMITGITDSSGRFDIQLTKALGASVKISILGAEDENTTLVVTDPAVAEVVINGIDYDQPEIFKTSFAVQSGIDFRFDANQNFWANLVNYLQQFSSGRYTGVNLLTSGFVFRVDNFQLFQTAGDESGIRSARGRAIVGGETLNFSFNGPRGLVMRGTELTEINATFSGSLPLLGARLQLDNLSARYVAADKVAGTSAGFRLTGSTEIEINGQRVGLSLPGSGLVITDQGVQSLEARLSGSLRIAGETLDLGSLSASYNRDTDTLRLTGRSQLLSLGSAEGQKIFGLDDVVLEITQGRISGFSARVSGTYTIAGATVTLNTLSLAYSAQEDTLSLAGETTLQLGESSLSLSLFGRGLTISPSGVAINGRINGSVQLAGSQLGLTNLELNYAEGGLQIRGGAELAVGETKLALASMDLRWREGAFLSLSARVGGEVEISQAVVKLDTIQARYNVDTQHLELIGSAQVLLQSGEANGENKGVRVLGIQGSIVVKGGGVESLDGTVESGALSIAGGSLELRSLRLSYNRLQQSFNITGSGRLAIAGAELIADLQPALSWRQGTFSEFNARLSGLLPIQRDGSGKVTAAVEVKDFSASYIVASATLTLRGSGEVWMGLNRGLIETDPLGIVIAYGSLQAFSAYLTLGIGFGSEQFTDANVNGVREENEAYIDVNGNQVFDGGFTIAVNRAGLLYLAASATPARLRLSGMGRLDFDGAGPRNEGVEIDLSTTGIELVGGEIENFTLAVRTAFRLGTLDFTPGSGTAVGFRYQRALGQIDVFGVVDMKVAANTFAFSLGSSFDNPGIRLQNGAITYAAAAITTDFGIGDLRIGSDGAGFTYNSALAAWAIYGSVSLRNVFSVNIDLGTQSAPGLLIRNNDWEIRGSSFRAAAFNLGAVRFDDVTINLQRTSSTWMISGSAALFLPMGIGVSGSFQLLNGFVSSISLGLYSEIGISIPQTPLFVTSLEGSIRNLDNPAAITITGRIGLRAGPGVILFGKSAVAAQFVGEFTIDAGSMKLKADAYIGAFNLGSISKPEWVGLIGQGTAVILLDWSRNIYYGDISASLLGGTFLSTGRMAFTNGDTLSLRGTAMLRIPDEIPIAGGYSIAGADFLFLVQPGREAYAMGWGQLLGFTVGLKYDILKDSFSIIGDADVNALPTSLRIGQAEKATVPSVSSGSSQTFQALSAEMPVDGPPAIGLPVLITRPGTPGVIDTGRQTTRLSGRVQNPNRRTVSVSLFYSLDEAGDFEFPVNLPNNQGVATGIQVPVNPDGSWSVDIDWDATNLPSGALWLYGQVDDDGPWVPVYSASSVPFQVVRDVEGRIVESEGPSFIGVPVLRGRPGVPVFADLDDDGLWDPGIEPRAISDARGYWFLDVPGSDVLGEGKPVPIIHDLPDYVSPIAGTSARQMVTLREAGAFLGLQVSITRPVISGRVTVDSGGAPGTLIDRLQQPVSGLAIVVRGPDGRDYRVATDNDGRYEVPVELTGDYTATVDFEGASFLGNPIRPARDRKTVQQLRVRGAGAVWAEQIRVDSVGIVRSLEANNLSSLPTLIALSNEGFLSSIEFDNSLRNSTIELDPPDFPAPTSYYLYDEENQRWEIVEPPADIVMSAGLSAFVIRDDLQIRGGDLNITLKPRVVSTPIPFRAFHVLPGIILDIQGIRMEGFSSQGADGAAGRGGAILNQGTTIVRDGTFVGNRARRSTTSKVSGKGGAIHSARDAQLLLIGRINFQANVARRGSAIWSDGVILYGSDLSETNRDSSLTNLFELHISDATGRNVPVNISMVRGGFRGFIASDASVWLRPGIRLDHEIQALYSKNMVLRSAAIHGAGARRSRFNLTVSNVNEAPLSMQLSNSIISENQPAGSLVGWMSTMDRDREEFFVYSLVAGNGSSDNAFFEIRGGQLLSREAFNFEWKSSYSIRIRSTDRNGLFVERIFVIRIRNLSESPTTLDINIPAIITVAANTPGPLLFTQAPLRDANPSSTHVLTVTLQLSAGEIQAGPVSDVLVSGTARSRSFTGTMDALNRYFTDPAGFLLFEPPGNGSTMETLTVIARYRKRYRRRFVTARTQLAVQPGVNQNQRVAAI